MKTCSRKILELFYNAKHSGRVIKPDAIGRIGEDDDGLVIELTWRVINNVIMEAKFRAFGNPNAIAITSLMTDYIIGKSIDDAMLIDENVIKEALDEIRPEYIEAFDTVKMAMTEAYNNYLKRQSRQDGAESEYNAQTVEYYYASQSTGLEQGSDDFELGNINVFEAENVGVRRGRGRPRKIVDESQIVEVGEKRGRGRPRKIVDETVDENVITEKRGRGRPRKIVDETEIVEQGEKRGRGRPRKERPEGEDDIVTEKRGRGRPRKIIDESQMVEVGEKRGRGRPRKIVDENEIVEQGEKRGRGRPRKERPEGEVDIVTEKRNRGRPRKLTIETLEVEDIEEKRGRGRPRKEEVRINLPKSDLDEVINDKDVEELINGKADKEETNTFVDNLISNKLIDEDDETFDADYDLFKSNIRNIFSGKEVDHSAQQYGVKVLSKLEAHEVVENIDENILDKQSTDETSNTEDNKNIDDTTTINNGMTDEVKRGRGRPRKEHVEVEEVGEKRGRGRPKKIVIETIEETATQKPNRVSPSINATNSLTRSLATVGGVPSYNNTQDIVFASKNVTTTNININVTKTTTSVEDNKSYSDDYSKSVNISSVEENSTVSAPADLLEEDEEIEIIPTVNQNNGLSFNPVEDDEEDYSDVKELEESDEFDDEEQVDDTHIKDEAPKGGIEDLLKALLGDD